jgi:dTDP-glucose 4,6-dehydratase
VHPQPEAYWGNVNPVGPRAVYDEAKRFAEALTTAYRTAYGLDTAIARIFNTYGTRMRPHDGRVVPNFVAQALAGEPLTVFGDGSQTRSLCHVSDTARGPADAGRVRPSGPMNIGNPHELTVREIADTILAATGSGSTVVHADLPEDDPKVRCPDITLARTELGWEPRVDLADGLASTIEWFASIRATA